MLKADKIIVEYQMGWKWKAPDMHALQHVLGKHGNLGQKSSEAGDNNAVEEAAADTTQGSENKHQVSGAKIRGMLKLLANEAGFLINPDVVKS